jgi:hypothetical protein
MIHQQEEETPAAIRKKLPEIQEQTKKNNKEAQKIPSTLLSRPVLPLHEYLFVT